MRGGVCGTSDGGGCGGEARVDRAADDAGGANGDTGAAVAGIVDADQPGGAATGDRGGSTTVDVGGGSAHRGDGSAKHVSGLANRGLGASGQIKGSNVTNRSGARGGAFAGSGAYGRCEGGCGLQRTVIADGGTAAGGNVETIDRGDGAERVSGTGHGGCGGTDHIGSRTNQTAGGVASHGDRGGGNALSGKAGRVAGGCSSGAGGSGRGVLAGEAPDGAFVANGQSAVLDTCGDVCPSRGVTGAVDGESRRRIGGVAATGDAGISTGDDPSIGVTDTGNDALGRGGGGSTGHARGAGGGGDPICEGTRVGGDGGAITKHHTAGGGITGARDANGIVLGCGGRGVGRRTGGTRIDAGG